MLETTARRPLSVTLIAWLFIVTGAGAIAAHLSQMKALESDMAWPLGLSALAVLGGVFMLRGANWARWLCLAWMAAHVVISAFHSIPEIAIHAAFLAVLLYFLLRPAVTEYFVPGL